MTPNSPIFLLTKLNLSEGQEKIRDQGFFMDEGRSSPYNIPHKYLVFLPPYVTNNPFLLDLFVQALKKIDFLFILS